MSRRLLHLCVMLGLALPTPSSSFPRRGPASLPWQAQPDAKLEAGPRIEPRRPGFELPHAQILHYEGEWRFIKAGVATLKLEHVGAQEHAAGTADTTGLVALLFRVQDRFDSYFDANRLCSSKLVKHTEEGSHLRDTTITYDYARGKAVLEETNLKNHEQKRTENDIPGCVTDVVSGIFYVASLPLQPGATYTFPLNDGGKTATVQAHAEEKEQIKTPAGTFSTIRVEPEGDSGVLRGRGRIWIWYTDDARHLPVQMRARTQWGTLSVYLSSVEK